MVALAILGVALVAIFQLFSVSLRSTRKAEDYARALFYARALLDESYSLLDPEGKVSVEMAEGFKSEKSVSLKMASEDEKVKLYEIAVTVTWPPSGRVAVKGLRSIHESEE